MEVVPSQQQQRETVTVDKELIPYLKMRIADLYMRLDEVEVEKRIYLERIQKLEKEKV
jgi:hypothetical protein